MIKYLIVLALGYYIYQQYFLGRHSNNLGNKENQANLNNNKGDYVDYEEVE